MRRGIILGVLVIVIVLAIGFIAASVLHNGVSAKATPTPLEVMMARKARHMAISKEARDLQNPLTATPENLHEGMLHFADHCAICHGNDGSCDTMMGSGLYPKPPDLRTAETQKLTDGELFWVIENGVRFTGMPAFSTHDSTPADSWKLVLFVRHLPQLTSAEKVEMEQYNPKGPDDRDEEKAEDDFLNGTTATAPKESHHKH